MAAKVRIPAPLRKLTKEQPVVDIAGKNIEEVLANLEKQYPGIKERICDENGQIRRFINVFVNGEDIRFKEGAKTSVSEGAEISIIPAIAGGSTHRTEDSGLRTESDLAVAQSCRHD
ncbi:MAG TPA: ubiquitin-like small modifier protein 1 [Elusimicrobiota bacterium]|nr:ubiquitin-like small modifier protein 1 [Elusimicrobiota bacterium]